MIKETFYKLTDIQKANYLESVIDKFPKDRVKHLEFWINQAEQGIVRQPDPDLRETGEVLNLYFVRYLS